MMGDMNWHNHAGLRIIAAKSAIQFKFHYLFMAGQAGIFLECFHVNNYAEFNKKTY